MEVIVMFAIIVVGLVVVALMGLDVAALSWGADSRERLPDDHAR